MAKVYYNNQQHLVIQMNVNEATELNFGIPITGLQNLCICGTCNNECKPEKIYYVAGINEIMCGDCIVDFCKNMNHYTDDNSLDYEQAHFNKIAEKLNMKERAVRTSDGKLIIVNKDKIPVTD